MLHRGLQIFYGPRTFLFRSWGVGLHTGSPIAATFIDCDSLPHFSLVHNYDIVNLRYPWGTRFLIIHNFTLVYEYTLNQNVKLYKRCVCVCVCKRANIILLVLCWHAWVFQTRGVCCYAGQRTAWVLLSMTAFANFWWNENHVFRGYKFLVHQWPSYFCLTRLPNHDSAAVIVRFVLSSSSLARLQYLLLSGRKRIFALVDILAVKKLQLNYLRLLTVEYRAIYMLCQLILIGDLYLPCLHES